MCGHDTHFCSNLIWKEAIHGLTEPRGWLWCGLRWWSHLCPLPAGPGYYREGWFSGTLTIFSRMCAHCPTETLLWVVACSCFPGLPGKNAAEKWLLCGTGEKLKERTGLTPRTSPHSDIMGFWKIICIAGFFSEDKIVVLTDKQLSNFGSMISSEFPGPL